MEKSQETVVKDGNVFKVTIEKRRFRKPLLRVYYNGNLMLETIHYPEVNEMRRNQFGITDRDMGILPADPAEWTREEMLNLIESMKERKEDKTEELLLLAKLKESSRKDGS